MAAMVDSKPMSSVEVTDGSLRTAAEKAKSAAPTLVVVPTSALVQWEEEIRNCTKPDSLKVLVYYADRKALTKEMLESVDVVLTTYPAGEDPRLTLV